VVTSTDGEHFAADGVNWLTQASFELPLVVTGVKVDSKLAPLIERSRSFAVNVLAHDQLEVAKAFFRSTSVEGDLLNGHRFERGAVTGAPILDEVPYWFEARVTDTVARGNHTVYVAEVVGRGCS
jgi:flavin reductase (DIM6/NTAB) family NADH-FMN oxidoreductase RutF